MFGDDLDNNVDWDRTAKAAPDCALDLRGGDLVFGSSHNRRPK
jgi:hypothetical protein